MKTMGRSGCLALSLRLICLVLLTVTAIADTIYVPTGTNIVTIQDGINAAQDGDTVLVANGVYLGGIDFIGKSIVVKSVNGPSNCVISAGHTDLRVAFKSGEGPAARLGGFIVRNGHSSSGGGIHVGAGAAPTIANCIITNNQSIASAGGGINIDSASPTITNCTVSFNLAGVDPINSSSDNFVGSGGGIFCKGLSRPLIVDCVISGNHAYGKNGGGIHCYNSSPTIRRCTITGNSVEQDGGGISCKDQAAPLIIDCIISGNSGGSQGGGVNMSRSSPTIRRCVISGNHSVFDGGISVWDLSAPLILDCTIAKNRADYYGPIYAGGIGMQKSSPMIANCLIYENSALSGAGAIMVSDSSFPSIVNCTITGNLSEDANPGDAAGGIFSKDSVVTLVNSILWADIGPEIYVNNTIFYPNRVPVVSYCDVHWGGTGNIHADPLFVDPANENFRLKAGSPCIDTGTNAKTPDDDMEGIPRPQDGNGDGLAIVDMGPYEVAGPSGLLTGFLLNSSDPAYIPDAAFRDPANRAVLGNNFEAVLQMMERGEYRQALDILENDILKTMDGCASFGTADQDDWVVNCQYQTLPYQRVALAISSLRPLVSGSSLSVAVAEGYCWIGIPTEPGSTYQLQYSTNLSSWETLVENIPGTGDFYPILDPVPVASQATRFYRTFQFSGPAPGEPLGNPNPAAWAWVSPGAFTIGSGTSSSGHESDEAPPTMVVFTNGFWVSRFEVSQEEYLNLTGLNPAWFTGNTDRPVEYVSYDEATNYCALLTAREQAAGRLPAGYFYRLPTEAEWEYACRAGSTTEFCYGDDPGGSALGHYAWFWDNSGSTNAPPGPSYYMDGKYYTSQPVGTRQLNRWGLGDMHGNVWEWCLDWYGAYPGGTVTNYSGAISGTSRVIRGGCWNGGPASCRSANRSATPPDGRSSGVGFRVILAN